MPAYRDLENNVDVSYGFAPQTFTATGTGTAVELRDYNSAMVIVSLGTVATGGTLTPSLTESDDGTTYTAVASGDLSAAFTAGTATIAVFQRVGYKGTGRYIKPVITQSGTGAGAVGNVIIVRGDAARRPL